MQKSMLLLMLGVLGVMTSTAAENANRIDLKQDDMTKAVYRFGDVAYKPYVEKLFTPNGLNVLRDAPEDHVHHHGLMFAVKVDGVNFWEEYENPGIQEHQSIVTEEQETGQNIIQHIHWLTPKKESVLMKEQRSITLMQDETLDATLLHWESVFSLPEGKDEATITGSHYHGLGMRFVESMDKHCEFRNKEGHKGEIFRGKECLTEATWCAILAKVEGKPVTVAMFAHPDNPRPTTWFTMPEHFAYMSATGRYHETPLKLSAPALLTLHYGVMLWDSHQDDETITRGFEAWLDRVK